MTTSAKISKNFVSILIGMGQPLETFCNKNLSIPFFFESQQETGRDCMSVVLDRTYMCMIINSLKKLVLGKYPLFERLCCNY